MLRRFAVIAVLISLPATAQVALPNGFVYETVFSGPFPGVFPMDMEFLPDGRMVVATKGGSLLLLLPSGSASHVMGSVAVEVTGERGISGIAVDPGFVANGHVYMHYAPVGTNTVRISRFTLVGDRTDRSSLNLTMVDEYIIVDGIQDTHFQHSGGGMAVGSDGLLYSAHGDDRDNCQAADRTTALGTVLRLDVTGLPPGPGGPAPLGALVPADNPFALSTDPIERLVVAWGLRQPFTLELDEVDQKLLVGDVGDFIAEEIDCLDLAPPGGLAGANFGWPEMEGTSPKLPCAAGNPIPPLDHAPPLYESLHTGGAVAIMLVTRYRNGGRLSDFGAAYEGDLFVCDWGTGKLQRLRETAGVWSLAPPEPGQPTPESWGTGFSGATRWKRGPDGALYHLASAPGTIGRVRPAGLDHEIICEPTLGAPGSIDIAFRGVGGAPGNLYFYGLAVDNAGAAPNGWFFGIDMTLQEIQTQINLFFGAFDALGQFELRLALGPQPCPLGITLDAVLLEFGAGGVLVGQGPAKTLTF